MQSESATEERCIMYDLVTVMSWCTRCLVKVSRYTNASLPDERGRSNGIPMEERVATVLMRGRTNGNCEAGPASRNCSQQMTAVAVISKRKDTRLWGRRQRGHSMIPSRIQFRFMGCSAPRRLRRNDRRQALSGRSCNAGEVRETTSRIR